MRSRKESMTLLDLVSMGELAEAKAEIAQLRAALVPSQMGRLEDGMPDRTRELVASNQSLGSVNRRVLEQSAAHLKHFAMMCHEIRTPLNCITTIPNLLSDTEMNATQQDFIKMISNSGDLLCCVVNDLLDHSKLESGNVEVNIQCTNLREMMDTVVKSIGIKGGERKLVIRSLIDDRLPTFAETDESRLRRFFTICLVTRSKFQKIAVLSM
jgi:signal transduction histidine kinase